MSNLVKRIVFLFVWLIPIVCFSIPGNSHILGNNWYCNDGYKKQGNRCIKLIVPENAHVLGNNWYCDDGYKKIGNTCVKMTQKEIKQLNDLMKKQLAAMSDGTVAYKTKIDSDHDDILKLENGAIVEITSGYIGYIGYRKTAILFGSGSMFRIWIEGKKVFTCELLKKPVEKASPAKQIHISKVKGDEQS